jgi:hypothetical protein
MFGGKGRLKLSPDLLERAGKAAETAGYSTVEEFVAHVLDREIGKIEGAKRDSGEDAEALKERLRGLGYIS